MTNGPVVTGDAVLHALEAVVDPELDRSIVELGFVQDLEVAGGDVRVALTLPTYWCAPALAWMIALDAREAILPIPGVRRATVVLDGHHAGTEITEGVNQRAAFAEAFAGEVDGDLEDLRALFRRKAYLVKLSRLASAVPETSQRDLTIGELPDSDESRAYLAARANVGLDCGPSALVVADPAGTAVPDRSRFLRSAQTVRVSVEGNAAMCRSLLDARLSRDGGSGSTARLPASGG
jgi:metal-sulfur cluster biosynthetic enzyme